MAVSKLAAEVHCLRSGAWFTLFGIVARSCPGVSLRDPGEGPDLAHPEQVMRGTDPPFNRLRSPPACGLVG
jgi:hypothetical protein